MSEAPAAPAPAAPSAPSAPSSTPSSDSGGAPRRMSIHDFKHGRNAPEPEAAEPEVEEPSEPEEATDTATELEPPEEEEESPEPEEEDLSWAAEIKDFRELHGLPLAEILQAISQGHLPDQLLNVLKVRLKDGDYEWEDTIEGARKGAMLRRDYTKKRQADAREREAWTTEKNELVGLLHGWHGDSTGRAFLAGAQRMGFPILEAAKLLAMEHAKLAQMSPEARELYEQKQKAEQELERFKYEQDRAQRQQREVESKASVDKHVEFVTNTAQTYFQRAEIPLNRGSWGVFLRHFDAIRSANPSEPWTEQMVQIAVEATKEDYEDLKRQVGAAHTPVTKPQVLTKPQQGSPGRQQLAQAGLGGQKFDSGKTPPPKNNKVSISDFKKRFGMR